MDKLSQDFVIERLKESTKTMSPHELLEDIPLSSYYILKYSYQLSSFFIQVTLFYPNDLVRGHDTKGNWEQHLLKLFWYNSSFGGDLKMWIKTITWSWRVFQDELRSARLVSFAAADWSTDNGLLFKSKDALRSRLQGSWWAASKLGTLADTL